MVKFDKNRGYDRIEDRRKKPVGGGGDLGGRGPGRVATPAGNTERQYKADMAQRKRSLKPRTRPV